MPLISNFLAIIGLLVAFTVGVAPSSARAEQRIALVLGNAAYETGALKTPANDAGLIAQTLEAAGFEVIGARDLDNDALRRAFRDFVDKAAAVGPDGVAGPGACRLVDSRAAAKLTPGIASRQYRDGAQGRVLCPTSGHLAAL